MTTEAQPTKHWKKKLKHELIDYWINVIYLALYFAVFINYKRLVLAEHGIIYTNYGVAVIQALVLGKVVSVGTMMKLGHSPKDKPLITIILRRSVFFTIWLTLFNVIEEMVRGLIRTGTLDGSIEGLKHLGSYEYMGGMLVVFTSFIPFFLVKELSRVLGPGVISGLLFKGRTSAS
jgi:hypothetical protein